MTRNPAPAADADALDPASLFRGLAGRRGLILAVSGGPDSTALMLLASRWRERPPVLVVTVDHGLRPEAADEARLVAENAATLGLAVRGSCTPAEPRSAGNLQDWARRARYACLADSGARGRLRHDRHRASPGRSGRDVSAAGWRAARASTGSPPCARRRRSTASCSRGRCSTFRAPRLQKIAAESGLADRRRSEQPRSRASIACACAR